MQSDLQKDVGTVEDLAAVTSRYQAALAKTMAEFDWSVIHELAFELLSCWKEGRQFFVCGNGGSGANAVHMANDFIYGISKRFGSGLKCHALSENGAMMTCLANDEGYAEIFSYQLGVLAKAGDVLLVLSGSGNSPNILRALEAGNKMGLRTYGILGYSGGKAKGLAQHPIHFEIDDMQISEDLQMIVAHMISQWLYLYRDSIE